MIKIQSNFSLKEHNTFGVSAFAKAYTAIDHHSQFEQALSYYSGQELFILSGGSNMLLTQDIEKPVLHIKTKGVITETLADGSVLLTAQAGENWNELVMYCVENNLAGMENLALIPGTVGTAPVQNIGAYGVELKDIIHSCELIDLKTRAAAKLTATQCKLSYRDSIFKREAAGKYIITAVTFKLKDLSKTHDYKLKTSYGAIQEQLDSLSGEPTIKDVAQAVIKIRSSKLPDPKQLGNSGSFFKNPIIPIEKYQQLKALFKEMPHYPINDRMVKVPAGWLIENAGLKGYRTGDAAVHDKQALVLVNHGSATGAEILALARKVQKAVHDKYDITIDTEVNIF